VVTPGLQADCIQSLDADGFTVGADALVNQNYEHYFWAAFQAHNELAVGSYVGSGVADSVSGLDFQPDWVLVMPEDVDAAHHRHGTMVGDAASTFGAATAQTDRITAITTDGFDLGTDDSVNENTITYHYVVFKEVEKHFATGEYVGDGVTRDITGLGFEPEMVIIKSDDADVAQIRTHSVGGRNHTFSFDAGGATADAIVLIRPDGFRLGDADTVNRLTTNYRWIAVGRAYGQDPVRPWVRQWAETNPRN
jgi:hypothetical protein